jgi:hypothetical protein
MSPSQQNLPWPSYLELLTPFWPFLCSNYHYCFFFFFFFSLTTCLCHYNGRATGMETFCSILFIAATITQGQILTTLRRFHRAHHIRLSFIKSRYKEIHLPAGFPQSFLSCIGCALLLGYKISRYMRDILVWEAKISLHSFCIIFPDFKLLSPQNCIPYPNL